MTKILGSATEKVVVNDKILSVVYKLIEALNTERVLYCHWKSNITLEKGLLGQTDIDLLVHRKDAEKFNSILSELGFKSVVYEVGKDFPSMEHYVALDEESGILVHVHVYYRVVTGESLAKNYRLPVEDMLLENTWFVQGVRLPIKSAELVVFTVRMMLKHTTLVELYLLARGFEEMKREILWLLEDGDIDETLKFVSDWIPTIDASLFGECVAALRSPASFLRRVYLGQRLRLQIRFYMRRSGYGAWLTGMRKIGIMVIGRLWKSKRGMAFRSGGAVIAFVGPEATGKSTLISQMEGWLSDHFMVARVHSGKPNSSLVSVLPNLLLPVLRSMLPKYRSGYIEAEYNSSGGIEKSEKLYPLLFALRSVLLAFDRRLVLRRAFRLASNGTIVLCDRYPSLQSGAADSPQLHHLPVDFSRYSLRRLAAKLEMRFYNEIPLPDMVVLLSVPIEVAILRNNSRGKMEPQDYVRRRHLESSKLVFGDTPVYKLNTNRPLETTILDAKKIIWNAM